MTDLIKQGVKVVGKRVFSEAQDAELLALGRKIERFEIDAYQPLCATAQENDWTHERALLTSILNQEKLAQELLGGLAEGNGPLDERVERASLKYGAGDAA